ALDTDHATHKIENDENGKHSKDRDSADPAQRHAMEVSPITASWLLKNAGSPVRDADTSLDAVQFLQQLLLVDRTGSRIDP
ncbi:hypothetical protein ABK046_45740, partial [Streptomyces caeruleatus]